MALLAVNHPQTKSDLSKIHGFGAKTLEKYGDDILSILGSGESING